MPLHQNPALLMSDDQNMARAGQNIYFPGRKVVSVHPQAARRYNLNRLYFNLNGISYY